METLRKDTPHSWKSCHNNPYLSLKGSELIQGRAERDMENISLSPMGAVEVPERACCHSRQQNSSVSHNRSVFTI